MVPDWIYSSAEKANEVCERKNLYRRFWIIEDRFFICNNVEAMDDIDEVSMDEFLLKIKRLSDGL